MSMCEASDSSALIPYLSLHAELLIDVILGIGILRSLSRKVLQLHHRALLSGELTKPKSVTARNCDMIYVWCAKVSTGADKDDDAGDGDSATQALPVDVSWVLIIKFH